MKTRLLALATVVVLVAGACAAQTTPSASTGGGATATPAGTTSGTPAASTKLTVWLRNYVVAQDEPSKTTDFEAKHPGVTLDITGAPYDPQFQRIELSRAGQISDKPDLFQMDNIWLGQFVDEKVLANLDSYYANWADKGDVLPAFAESTKVNGSQYAAWWYSDIRLMIWNKDVFKKAGLDPEKGPATWAEVMADAQKIKDNVPGVSPVGFPAASQEGTVDRFYSFIYMTGSNVLSPDNKTAVFNDAGGQKALQFYVDLVNKGYASKDLLTQDADAVVNGLFAGKYGIMLATVGDGLGDKPEGMDAATFQKTIGAALPPLCDGCQKASTAGGWMLGINADSPNKDLAWDYLTAVSDGKHMVPFEVQYTRVPVRKSGLDMSDSFKGDPYFAAEAEAASVAHFPPFIPKYTQMIEFIWTAIQKAVNGDMSVKDALDEGAKGVNDLLAAPAS